MLNTTRYDIGYEGKSITNPEKQRKTDRATHSKVDKLVLLVGAVPTSLTFIL